MHVTRMYCLLFVCDCFPVIKHHTINNHKCEVKKALPRQDMLDKPAMGRGMGGGGGGGGGMMRGGRAGGRGM